MKTKLTLCLFFLFGTLTCQKLFGQADTIRIDFKTKRVELPQSMKYGDLCYLKISNINMNLYKINIDSKDSLFISNVSFPSFDMIGLDNLTTLLSNMTELTTFSQSLLSSNKNATEFNTLSNNGQTRFPKYGSNEADNVKKNLVDPDKENIIHEINTRITELKKLGPVLERQNLSIDSLILYIQISYLSYYTNNTIIENPLKNKISCSDILKKSEEHRSEIKEIIKYLEVNTTSYAEFYSKNKLKIDNDTDLKRADKELKEAYSSSIENASKVYESVSSEKVIGFLKSLIYVENNSSTTFTSLPIQLKGDITTVNIKIEAQKDEFALPKFHTELDLILTNRIYIGTGISFYTSNLHNDSYSVRAIVADSLNANYSIVEENLNKKEIGIATLLHFGWKTCIDNFGLHLSIGPALSISTTIKPRLTFGGGISYGKKQRLTFDILGIGGFVDRKSNVFSVNENYSEKPSQITVSKLSFGYAFSFGYIYNF
jgi:hypothetical protein